MKVHTLAGGLSLVLIVLFVLGAAAQSPVVTPVKGYFEPVQPSGWGLSRGIDPGSDPFFITETGEIEPSSAAAYGGGKYVAVFVRKNRDQLNSVYAADISNLDMGPLVYPISNHTHHCEHPAIAYHAGSGLFIIIYTHHQQDIYAVVFSPSTEFIGPAQLISDDEVIKGYPAVACNQLDNVCLVAYQQGGTQIKGRYVRVSSEGITGLSENHILAEADHVDQPRLAWGRGEGTFLLAYNEQRSSGEVESIYTHVFDQDDPLVAEKRLNPSAPVLPDGLLPPGSRAFLTNAAFDPCTKKFVLTLKYDAAGDGGEFALWAAVVHARDAISSGAYLIAQGPVSEQGGAIGFITADHSHPACGAMDRLLAAYVHTEDGLMLAELRGNSNPTAASYAVDADEHHVVLAGHSYMVQQFTAALASGSPDGPVMILSERFFPFSTTYDLWGQFLIVRTHTYLPLVLR